jgi:spore germination protein YaaH
MVARKLAARVVAPVALAAPIVGGYLIVHHYAVTHHSHPAQAHHADTARKPRGKYSRARFYRVKSGDNLTRISARTGVSVDRLEVLNPRINPNALQTGQRIRLRR